MSESKPDGTSQPLSPDAKQDPFSPITDEGRSASAEHQGEGLTRSPSIPTITGKPVVAVSEAMNTPEEGEEEGRKRSLTRTPSVDTYRSRSSSFARKRTLSVAQDEEELKPPPVEVKPLRPLPEEVKSASDLRPRRRSSATAAPSSDAVVKRFEGLVKKTLDKYSSVLQQIATPRTRMARAIMKKSLPAALPKSNEEDDFGGLTDVLQTSAPMPTRASRAPVTAGGPRTRIDSPSSPGEPVREQVDAEHREKDFEPGMHRFEANEDGGLVDQRRPSKLPRSIVHEALETTYSENDEALDEDDEEVEDAPHKSRIRRCCGWCGSTITTWFRGDIPLICFGVLFLIAYFIVEDATNATWSGAAVQDWLLVAAVGIFIVSATNRDVCAAIDGKGV